MGNTQDNKVDKEKGQFIRLMMKHGYTLKEAQKEFIQHKQILEHAQEIANATGKPITIVTEIVLDTPLTIIKEKNATNKTKGQIKET